MSTARPSDLFIGVFPTGISYADRSRERHGDHLKLAFLPYDTLELQWQPRTMVPPGLRSEILADARRMIARHGQAFSISGAEQTVMLGSRGKKTPAELDREIEAFLRSYS